jgi:hypothetical protein
LRRVLGIESEAQGPKAWNLSRFGDRLGEEPHRTWLQQIFGDMIERRGAVVPDMGRGTAGAANRPSPSSQCFDLPDQFDVA